MDKKIWLKVIREELTLLDELASGMIEDPDLTAEEVDLAINRATMIAREFQVLKINLGAVSGERLASSVVAEPLLEPAKPAHAPEIFAATSVVLPESAPEPLFVPEPVIIPEPVIVPEPVVVQAPVVAPEPVTVFIPAPAPIKEEGTVSEFVVTRETPPEPVIIAPPKAEPAEIFTRTPPVAFAVTDTVREVPRADIPYIPVESKEENLMDLAGQRDNTGSQFKATPLHSLRDGISLNDRYLFQRELFDSDKNKMDASIQALDKLSNIQDAVAYLKANFKWNKGEAAEKFLHLIKRRFG